MQNDTLALILQTDVSRSWFGQTIARSCSRGRVRAYSEVVVLAFLAGSCGGRSGLESSGQFHQGGSVVQATATGAGGLNAQGGNSSSNAVPLGGTAQGGLSSLGGTGPHGTSNTDTSACVESMCTSGGWCWLNPLPQGNSLFDVVVHDGEFWATGEDGLVLRGDGEHWLRCPTPTTESLRGSWFAPDGTLWVVGTGGIILSFDGRVWTTHHAEAGLFLNDVHGSSSTDVWVVGDQVVLHFDGVRWDRQLLQTQGALYCVWAHDSNDVWVGGTEAWHFNGTEWRLVSSLAGDAHGIWGDEKNTVWLASGDIVQCDRLGCQPIVTSSNAQFDIWGTSSNDIWSIGAGGGMHWDGSHWAAIEVPTSLTSAAGGSPYGFVAVGHFGRMYRRSASEWISLRAAIGSVWTDVWGTADDDIWISGNSIAHFDGQRLSLSNAPTAGGLQSVHGISGNDVWFAGCGGALMHWTGEQWSDHSIEPSPAPEVCFFAIWVESPTSAWAVGSVGLYYHWDGKAWSRSPSPATVANSRAVFGSGEQVFAGDDSGTLVVWQATGWQPITTLADERINAIWGASAKDLWLAGEGSGRGSLVHWTDGVASQQQVAATTLTDIWGTAASDVWATGDGRVFHFDGSTLAEQPSGVNLSTSHIWVSPTGVRWLVGGNGILWHAP